MGYSFNTKRYMEPMYQSCNIPSAPRQAWLLNLTARTSLISYDGVGSTSKHLAVPQGCRVQRHISEVLREAATKLALVISEPTLTRVQKLPCFQIAVAELFAPLHMHTRIHHHPAAFD